MTGTGTPLGSQYHLDCVIGRGGMGDVWRGTNSEGAAFAFKLLQPQYVEDGEIIRRFLGERQLLTSVHHPNVVGVRDMVAEGTTLAIVMDLIQGTDLRHHLRERGTLAAAEACRITSQIASGLGAIHARRIVHRDIKPENTLLDQTVSPPQVKVTDFGVARLVEESAARSMRTALAGTPLYMAPEVINGEVPTPRTDLYALGIVLYELLCGVPPFAGLAAGPMMQAHITMTPGRPAGIDDRLWGLIAQLVSKDPTQRPSEAVAVAEHLEHLAGWMVGRPALSQLSTPPPPVPANSTVSITSVAGAWITPTQLVTQWHSPPYPSGQDHPSEQHHPSGQDVTESAQTLNVATPEQRWRLAGDPGTPPRVLEWLAQRHPETQPAVASNPAATPELRQWLSAFGDPAGPGLGGRPVVHPIATPRPRIHRARNVMVGLGVAALVMGGAAVSANTLGLFGTPPPAATSGAPPGSSGTPVSTQTSGTETQAPPPATAEEVNALEPSESAPARSPVAEGGNTGPAVPPVGAWIAVLESLPQNERTLSEAESVAEQLTIPGHDVVVVDSSATPGLNSGYWAISVMPFETRLSAVGACASFSRPVGGTCYPRLIG